MNHNKQSKTSCNMDPNPSHQWHSLPPIPPYPAAPPLYPLAPPPPPPYAAAPPPPPPPYAAAPQPPPPPYSAPPFRPSEIPFQPQFHYAPPPPPHAPPPPPFHHDHNHQYSNPNSNTYSSFPHSGVKRSRVQEPLDDHILPDDERRLKLIREHGGFGFGLSPCTTFENPNSRDFMFGSVDRIDRIDRIDPRGGVYRVDSMYVNGGYNDRFREENSVNAYRNELGGVNRLHSKGGQGFHGHAFSASPSPPLPPLAGAGEGSGRHLQESMGSISPFAVSASKVAKYPLVPEVSSFSSGYLPNKGFQTSHHALPKTYPRELEQVSSQYSTSDEQKIVDASLLLKHPHRTTRPDHIVVILRGFPGSGKSYLAKILRDLEVENGGLAPRIHTMDDYFMTEVEKIDDSEGSKSSSSVRGRKSATKTVMKYCYEPEMEEAYRSSMLKAFKKTLDEGGYSFIIVDDRNLRVADFVQFWATAKRSGYEVYLLEAAYKDPAGCAARNIHGFTQDDIRKMVDQWEEAPSMYLQLDIKSLLHGDKFLDSEILEVDMDTGEGEGDATCMPSCSDESNAGKVGELPTSNGPRRDDQRLDETGFLCQKEDEAKELGKSKWSNDLDEDDALIHHSRGGKVNTLPGSNQSYRKKGKSVRWGDQVANTGFSIGAAKMANVSSLVIGPGVGYNLNTNPLAEADKMALGQNTGKMQNILREQLRAEHESFKAVFDKRKQRIGGFDLDEE